MYTNRPQSNTETGRRVYIYIKAIDFRLASIYSPQSLSLLWGKRHTIDLLHRKEVILRATWKTIHAHNWREAKYDIIVNNDMQINNIWPDLSPD